MARDDFSEAIKRVVAERAGYICSLCKCPTVGPHSDPGKSLKTGEACHLCAASPNGPRYDANQTPQERSDISNSIWLCNECSTRIDRDPGRFPLAELIELRRRHEDWLANGGIRPELPAVTLMTLDGLTLTESVGTIDGEMISQLREHRLEIHNLNELDLQSFSTEIQFPEPVVEAGYKAPVEIGVGFQPVRAEMTVMASKGGSVTRMRPPLPTNHYLLEIERIPARHSVVIALRTSLKPWLDHDVDYYSGIWEDVHTAPRVMWYLVGQFGFEYQGAILERRIFCPIAYDRDQRKFSIIEVRSDYGDWQPIRGVQFS